MFAEVLLSDFEAAVAGCALFLLGFVVGRR